MFLKIETEAKKRDITVSFMVSLILKDALKYQEIGTSVSTRRLTLKVLNIPGKDMRRLCFRSPESLIKKVNAFAKYSGYDLSLAVYALIEDTIVIRGLENVTKA